MSTTSTIDPAMSTASRSLRRAWNGSTSVTWVIVSRLRPSYSSRSTWQNGSSRPPNRLLVRRTPLATVRSLPLLGLSSTTMRSASPNG